MTVAVAKEAVLMIMIMRMTIKTTAAPTAAIRYFSVELQKTTTSCES
jgi:hypothetical protein